MDDLISRQAAIDALDEQIRQCDKALSAFDISMKDEYAVKVERASLVAFRETLEYMSSAQPGWIPVTERLPERGKDVLVTRDYDGRADHIKSCRYVEVASRYGEDDDVSWNSYSDEYKMTPKNHCVLAWMPLPEPYTGKDNSHD